MANINMNLTVDTTLDVVEQDGWMTIVGKAKSLLEYLGINGRGSKIK